MSSLADYDGIASTAFRWEASTDGRTWDSINLPANSPTILLGQALVGMKIRISANIVDNFGVETKVISAVTEPVRNVNDKPVGTLLIEVLAADIQSRTYNKNFEKCNFYLINYCLW